MNDLNFRSLENMQVPDELFERLLAIPETAERKPAVIPWYRRRAAVAAASLVLVSVLSLTVYFLFRNKTTPPVAVKPSSTEPAWATDAYGETIAPDEDRAPDGSVYYDENGNVIPPDKIVYGTESPSSTIIAPTEKGKTAPTTKLNPNDPTSQPNATESGAPFSDPTEPSTEVPWEKDPTEGDPEPIAPTEPLEPPDMPDPTSAPWDADSSIRVMLTADKVPSDGVVYCKFVSRVTGKVYGDYDDFDDERLMIRLSKIVYYYDCSAHFKVPFMFEADDCIYYVYDSKGNILYTGYCTLGSYY